MRETKRLGMTQKNNSLNDYNIEPFYFLEFYLCLSIYLPEGPNRPYLIKT